MNTIICKKFVLPSLVAVCSLLSGSWSAAVADPPNGAQGGAGGDQLSGEGEGEGGRGQCAGGGGQRMHPPPGMGGPGMGGPGMGGHGMGGPGMGGQGMFPPPPGMGGNGMCPPPPAGMGGPEMNLPMNELDLTDEQAERLARLREETMDKAAPAMASLHSLERQYRSALVQPEINRAAVIKVYGQLAAQKQAVNAIFSDSLVGSAEVLTPAQRKELKQKMIWNELRPMVIEKHTSAEKK